MALDRKYQKIFAKNAEATDLGVVGSKNAGSAQNSTDVETIQSLSNWETGLRAQVTSNDAPYLQDQNSIFYVITSQLAYLFQAGISEWNSQTEYVANRSIVLKNGKIFIAIVNNTNIEPEVTSGWNTSWFGFTDWIVKGMPYNASISSFFSGYPKGGRVIYTNTDGNKYYIESLKDNNTDVPSESNVYTITKSIQPLGVVGTSPNLPTPSESYLGKFYLVAAIGYPSFAYCWLCVYENNSYTWKYKMIKDVISFGEAVYVNSKYFALPDGIDSIWEIGGTDGAAHLQAYTWIGFLY